MGRSSAKSLNLVPPLIRQVALFAWLSRPHFVVGTALVYLVGISIARYETHFVNWIAFGLGLIAVWLVQIATHFLNEYYDRAGDALNLHRTFFSGGSGILRSNAVSPRLPLWAASGMLVLAVAVFSTLSSQPTFGIQAILIFGLAVVGAVAYCVPPLSLAYRGLGAFDTSIIVGLFVPLLAYDLQTGDISAVMLRACLPLMAVMFANMINVALPDYEADQVVHKRTLVVQLGRRRAAWVYTLTLIAAYVLAWLALPGTPTAFFALAAALLVGAISLQVLWTGGYSKAERFQLNTFLGITSFVAVAAAEAIGWWLAG